MESGNVLESVVEVVTQLVFGLVALGEVFEKGLVVVEQSLEVLLVHAAQASQHGGVLNSLQTLVHAEEHLWRWHKKDRMGGWIGWMEWVDWLIGWNGWIG